MADLLPDGVTVAQVLVIQMKGHLGGHAPFKLADILPPAGIGEAGPGSLAVNFLVSDVIFAFERIDLKLSMIKGLKS